MKEKVTPAQQIQTLRQRISGLELENREERTRSARLNDDLRAARARIDELLGEVDAWRKAAEGHRGEVQRLRGYRERVERVDDLQRGVPPMMKEVHGSPVEVGFR